MTWWQALILGLVEGLTEYLPVSSTGHLILVQRVMGIGGQAANAYAICIQAGAIVAVLGLYRHRLRQIGKGLIGSPGGLAGRRLGLNLVIGLLPAAIIGVVFDDLIEAKLFGLKPIVAAWFIGGLAILIVAWRMKQRSRRRGGRSLEQLTWQMALTIGFIQTLAMWPGTSRSLVTIVGGLLVGMSLAAAVEFSFLLGVLTLLAATVYKIHEAGPIMLEAYGWWPMLVGSMAAWVSAVVAVKWMVSYLRSHGLELFGYYRVAIAVVVGVLIICKVLS